MIFRKFLITIIIFFISIPFTSKSVISATNQTLITEKSKLNPLTSKPDSSPVDYQQPTGPATIVGNTVFSRGFISEPPANTVFPIKKGNQEIIDYVTTFVFVGRESETVKMIYWYFEDNNWKKSELIPNSDYKVSVKKQTVGVNSRFTTTVTIDTKSETFIPGKSYWIQYSHSFTGNRVLHSNLARLNIQNADIPAAGIEVEAEYSETFIDRDNNLLKAKFTNPESTDAIRWTLNSVIESLALVSPENMNTMYTLNQETNFFKENVNSTFDAGFPAQFTASSIEHPNISNSLDIHLGGLSALSENYETSTTWQPSKKAFNHLLASISHYQIVNITSYWELFYLHDSELKNPLYEFEANAFGFENLRQSAAFLTDFTIPTMHITSKNRDDKFKARIKFTIQYELPLSKEIGEEIIYSNLAEIDAPDSGKINHVPNFKFSTTEKELNNTAVLTLDNETFIGSDNPSLLDIYCPENNSYELHAFLSNLKNIKTNLTSSLEFSLQSDVFTTPIEPNSPTTILQINSSKKLDLSGKHTQMLILQSPLKIEEDETYQAEITWTLSPSTKESNSL